MFVKLGALPGSYENGEKISDVLAYNHFGTETIAPRPVLRMAAEKILSSEEFKKLLKAKLHNMAVNPIQVEKIEADLLRAIGSQSAAEARRIIDNGTELHLNAPATIKAKGFNKPLYETGAMSKMIDYEVE